LISYFTAKIVKAKFSPPVNSSRKGLALEFCPKPVSPIKRDPGDQKNLRDP
jgi:hypothetical protein